MQIRAKHFLISGCVQGVGFRYATQQKAQQLGIMGWVKNRDDGRVEVWAEGSEVQLDQLTIWLQQGPPNARVDHVAIEQAQVQAFADFSYASIA